MKKCSKCKVEKELSEFYKCQVSKDGYRSLCKQCRNETQKKWNSENKDKINSAKKRYYKKNKDEILVKSKELKKAKGEKYLAQQREYAKKRYHDNLERERQRCRNWREANPEKYKESNRKSCKKRYENNKDFYKKYGKWYRTTFKEKKEKSDKVWRENNPDKVKKYSRIAAKRARNKHPEKVKARLLVDYAIKKDFLIRPTECSKCGKEGRIEGHHEDYSKPLEVTWLCKKCHVELHKQTRG